jgi:hypothetical protein
MHGVVQSCPYRCLHASIHHWQMHAFIGWLLHPLFCPMFLPSGDAQHALHDDCRPRTEEVQHRRLQLLLPAH